MILKMSLRIVLSLPLVVVGNQCHCDEPIATRENAANRGNVNDSSNANAKPMTVENPLIEPSSLPLEAPDFLSIETQHFLPAFEMAMGEQMAETLAIADQPDPPTYENTLVALERSGATLRRVQSIFSHLAASHTNPAIQAIEVEISPRLAAHSDNILLNRRLFDRIDQLWQQRDTVASDEESSRLLIETHETFVRAGARLDDEKKTRIRQINEQLSSLATQFQNNLLALTQERSVIVDTVAELEGLDESELAAASETAKERGHAGKYVLVITNTTRQPVLGSLVSRELRRRVWEASARRGTGEKGGIDNRPLVMQTALLRAERASILGYPNHASFKLENQMAANPDAALAMLRDLVPQVLAKAKLEAEEILRLMKQDGIEGPVEPWDWEFYAEKVRAEKYELDEALVKPYLELESVLQYGAFYTMKRLYGVQFRERFDLPVYEPSVRVFNVHDENGDQIGLFYADYYRRDSKRGGAWMDALVSQSKLLGQLPVIVNVMNIPAPAEGQPTLMSLDHVTTLFHELGHGVHGLFSSVTYPSLAGTNVPRDFVEFPSTFHEDFAIDPAVLGSYAKHYQTGEPMPKSLLEKSIAASKFNQGFDTLEYLSAALLDLAWHSLSQEQAEALAELPDAPNAVEEFELQALRENGVDFHPVPPRYRSPFFAHVWSGGYSAGYYAYLWSEILAADGFAHVMARGGLTRENGQAYRDTILSKGGSREVMKQFIDFRGQKPTVDALLIRRGLR